MIENSTGKHYKYLMLIAMIYLLAIITPSVVGYKLVQLGPILTNAGSYVFPISYLAGDVFTEVYGYNAAKRLIWSAVPCSLGYGLLIVGLIHLPSPNFWHHQAAYNEVLNQTPRIIFGGTVGVVIGSFCNSYAIAKWKVLLHGKHFWMRCIGASLIGDAIELLIVTAIAYVGVFPIHMILRMTATVFVLRLIYVVVISFPTQLLTNALIKNEGIAIDYSDVIPNPFALK